MQHTILEGREFDDRHDTVRANAVVINEPLARALFPTVSAVGRELVAENGNRLTIIGIVADARFRKMAEPVKPTVFLPLSSLYFSGLHIVARTGGPAESMVPAIAETLRSIDSAKIERETTLDAHLQTAVRRDRVAMVFVAACAVLILLFAISGPYLLTRHAVTSRYDELAVRLAFGAQAKHIVRLVLSQALRATAIGVLLGAAMAAALAAVSADLTGFTAAAAVHVVAQTGALLATLCALSAAVPALKAYRLKPMAALK